MSDSNKPLAGLEEWEDFLKERYPEPQTAASPFKATDSEKRKEQFRNYEDDARPSVREFYRLNHRHQTYDFVQTRRKEYLSLNRREMSVWEALEYLNTLVDDSDPDTDLSQLDHLLQTAEQIRHDGYPRWFILTGLIHDLGKILCLYGEPQWAVVGDTFPVGCAWSDRIVFHQFFADNPDHNEYLYHATKDYLPKSAQYMIRYHSFYPAHRDGEYDYLMNDQDREMFKWVRAFNPYDLYTKSHQKPNWKELRPFYDDLIKEYFPAKLRW